jgi:hypothetical protein
MSRKPVRWWAARAFGRSPLMRAADRVEAWAVVVGLALLVAAAYPAMAIGQMGYDASSQTIATDTSDRHPVEATALGNSSSAPSIPESTNTMFTVNVRWFSQHAAHDTVTRVDEPVKAGDRVRIWLTDQGTVTTPPMTDADAHLIKIGTVALSWVVLAALIACAFMLLRSRLDRVRDRHWARGWLELVEDGGGSTTVTP